MQPTIASYFQKATCSSKKGTSTKINDQCAEDETTTNLKKHAIRNGVEKVDNFKDQKRKRLQSEKNETTSVLSYKKPKLDSGQPISTRIKKSVDPLTLFNVETKRVEGKQSLEIQDIQDETKGEAEKKLNCVTLIENVGSEDKIISSKGSLQKTKSSTMQKNTITNAKQDLETSVLSDEERFERKRVAAALYQRYKNRSSVINHGCKEVPEGKPNCLMGLTFLITGVLESLERKEAEDIIKRYGGKVLSTVGKRLNYLIVGEESGPQKMAKAEELRINIISEDDFFDLIRERSGASVVEKGNEKPRKSFSYNEKEKAQKNEEPDEGFSSSIKPKDKKESVTSSITNKGADLHVKNNFKTQFQEVKSDLKILDGALISWVDKYKPATIKDIVGQQGPASNVNKLINWLQKWYINHHGSKKLQKPNPWAKNDDGSYYKSALLSGPPGIGKTTTAVLVSKELGFDIVELNASDTRSKRSLREEVSQLLNNKSIYNFCHTSGVDKSLTRKHVLIMDEVDGIAGNEDRGGVQELIALIKGSAVPIICMCNDRNHPKMRSLVNYCYDLRFNRPQLKQIKAHILSICAKEAFHLESDKIDNIIKSTNCDIRQSVNHIALLSAGKHIDACKIESNEGGKYAQKDSKMGPWEVVRKVFSAEEQKTMSFNEKCDLFFHDYTLAPLFVQQNYLIVNPAGPRLKVLKKVALTANALSLSDIVEKNIRRQAVWSLLPIQAIFSSVMPGKYMSGHFTGQINFPLWLGKNSKVSKRKRLAQEIYDHTRVRTSGSNLSIRLDYAPYMVDKIINPLMTRGAKGVEESLNTIKEYHLLREDLENLLELTSWPRKKSPWDNVDGKVKAALTRSYNKEVLAYSYSVTEKIKHVNFTNEIGYMNGDEIENKGDISSSEENYDILEKESLVKMKTKATSAAASKSNGSKPHPGKKTNSTKSKAMNKRK